MSIESKFGIYKSPHANISVTNYRCMPILKRNWGGSGGHVQRSINPSLALFPSRPQNGPPQYLKRQDSICRYIVLLYFMFKINQNKLYWIIRKYCSGFWSNATPTPIPPLTLTHPAKICMWSWNTLLIMSTYIHVQTTSFIGKSNWPNFRTRQLCMCEKERG